MKQNNYFRVVTIGDYCYLYDCLNNIEYRLERKLINFISEEKIDIENLSKKLLIELNKIGFIDM